MYFCSPLCKNCSLRGSLVCLVEEEQQMLLILELIFKVYYFCKVLYLPIIYLKISIFIETFYGKCFSKDMFFT